MHIPVELYPAAYRSILNTARGSGTAVSTTFILVKPDVDALSAAKLLHELLKADYVNNTIIPVRDWDEVDMVKDDLMKENIRTLILINIGAIEPILDVFPFLKNSTVVHIIDSHRPIHLSNLHNSHVSSTALILEGRKAVDPDELPLSPLDEESEEGDEFIGSFAVVVWNDQDDEERRIQLMDIMDILKWEPDDDPNDDDDDDDSDEDEEAENEARGRYGGGSGDEDADGSPNAKRRRGSQSPQPLTKIQRRRHRARLDKYHAQGTYSGQSAANQLYLLAVLLGRVDEDAVWLAILGLTYQFSAGLIDRGRYDAYVALLTPEVERLTTAAANLDAAMSSGPNDRSVRASEELRFCLFRHWNLYDSMLHSGYVAGKMKLWKERGTKNLSGMLAKMGYSLLQSKETYAHMDSDLKSRLFINMDALGPEYGLTDLTYPSFIRKAGYRTDLSASDAVEGLSAILEAATGVRLDFGNVTGQNGVGTEDWAEGVRKWVERGDRNKENNKPDGAEPTTVGELALKLRESSTKNFWLAWDALNSDTSLLRDALPLAKALQRSVTAQGAYILDKQAIKTTRSYRFVLIKEGPYLAIFRHPILLLRLALWLVDAVRDLLGNGDSEADQRARTKSLPFVIACYVPDTERFTIVGVIGAGDAGDVKKNAFGLAFKHAAHLAGADFQMGTFDSATVNIDAASFAKFLKLLNLP